VVGSGTGGANNVDDCVLFDGGSHADVNGCMPVLGVSPIGYIGLGRNVCIVGLAVSFLNPVCEASRMDWSE